ncbi:unannotated protein [freshwater metagenome]|uniref:Unannotated protein n=1 Tax=freshwater metagenome TaxID=449393 RepID=A0A6J6JCU8_9ZZZZ
MLLNGIAAITKTVTVANTEIHGCLVDQSGFRSGSAAFFLEVFGFLPSASRSFLERIRSPISERAAGVAVIEIATARAIAIDPMVPIRPTNSIPVRLSAASAMITVMPAKRTAFPEVPVASAIDSFSATPDFICLRWRLRINSA